MIEEHIRQLSACTRCPQMGKPVVTGRPVASPVLLVGQAPGDKEPLFEPANDKVYRHPTFFPMPDEVKHL